MAYITLDDLKVKYLGIDADDTDDDDLLQEMIDAAQTTIDRETGRTFEASSDTPLTFYGDELTGDTLHWFDRDMAALSSVTVNGNAIDLTTVRLVPRRVTPSFGICFLSNAPNNNNDEIVVTGRWAWSVEPPADVALATKRLAAWAYRQKDNQHDGAARVIDSATGTIMIPAGLPKDVAELINTYMRNS